MEFGHGGSVFEIGTQQQAFRNQVPPPPLPGDTKQAGQAAKRPREQMLSDTGALCVDHAAAAGVGKQDPWCLQLFFKVNRMQLFTLLIFEGEVPKRCVSCRIPLCVPRCVCP